jgi:hypothetical protein
VGFIGCDELDEEPGDRPSAARSSSLWPMIHDSAVRPGRVPAAPAPVVEQGKAIPIEIVEVDDGEHELEPAGTGVVLHQDRTDEVQGENTAIQASTLASVS